MLPTSVARLAILTPLLVAGPAVAAADDGDQPIAVQEGMHVGVGVESTLGGVAGLSARHGLGPVAGLELVVAAAKGTGEYIPGGTLGAATTICTALRVIVPVRRTPRGTIAVVGGLDVGVGLEEMTDTVVHPGVEAGLRGELFLAANLSLSLEVGGVIDMVPSGGRVLMPERASSRADGTGTTLSLDNTALAGGAGLTFWFR
jgi:hypothetical protein